MSKNLIPEIAKMLGVELGEEFKVKGEDETTYIFADDGLKLIYDGGIGILEISSDVAFAALVNGKAEIVKLPWKPKKGDVFWSFYHSISSDKWLVISITWTNAVTDIARFKVGWCYRTEAEAKSALPVVATKLGVDYEI